MVAALSATLNQNQFQVLVGISLPGWLQDECERLNVKTRDIPLAGAFTCSGSGHVFTLSEMRTSH